MATWLFEEKQGFENGRYQKDKGHDL